MKKEKQSGRGRYVSAEKVQQMFADLGIELCSGRKRIRAARSEKSIIIYANGGTVNISFDFLCEFKKIVHLCNVLYLNQVSKLAKNIAASIFYAHSYTYSSVPCGALMRPLPDSGARQRGAELFLFLPQKKISYCFI